MTLGVLDANDNGPEFSSDLVVFQSAENQTAPLEIGSVVATDMDEGNLSNMTGNRGSTNAGMDWNGMDYWNGQFPWSTGLIGHAVCFPLSSLHYIPLC